MYIDRFFAAIRELNSLLREQQRKANAIPQLEHGQFPGLYYCQYSYYTCKAIAFQMIF